MPNYYNTYGVPSYNPYTVGQTNYTPYNQPQSFTYQPASNNQYMINVDGEMAARAWQMPNSVGPNTIIPLYDLDGEHVYFKSVDAYGRMNPLRKGRIIFDDDVQNLPQGQQSGAAKPVEQDMSHYVTKDDLDSLKQELKSMMAQTNTNNQNGNKSGRSESR